MSDAVIDRLRMESVSLADVLYPRFAPPLEAILAEVLTPHLYRRWLTAQGDRVFPVFSLSADNPNPLTAYLADVAGIRSDRDRSCRWISPVAHDLLPDWVRNCICPDPEHVFVHRGRPSFSAAHFVARLDTVLAERGITGEGVST